MKLIVGLGNPGSQYAATRHNLGFMVVDQLAADLGASWQLETKFQAELAWAELAGQKVLLAKPQTFMNLSGQAVQAIAQYYKIAPADAWVVFDDLDTPFGRLRIRQGGSSSGHQGVESTIRHLGQEFWRFKMGISLNDRAKEPSEAYVLKPFNANERPALPGIIEAAATQLRDQLPHTNPETVTLEL